MSITVLDTSHGIAEVLAAPSSRRADVLREVLAPMAGMYRWFPGDVDLVAMHSASFGFALDSPAAGTRRALDELRAADAWARIERASTRALERQSRAVPGLRVPDVTVSLMVGDAGDDYFAGPARGFSGNGSVPGFVTLTVLPTDENLGRLEAAAVHELHHNLRYSPGGVVWDPATVTVGEQIVSEGLADAFARQLHGDTGYTPVGRPHLDDDDVLRRVVGGLDVTGMREFIAWVHGDAAALRFGATPVGLPTGAGYAVGNRIVDAYLAATGTSAADALHVPSRAIVEIGVGGLLG